MSILASLPFGRPGAPCLIRWCGLILERAISGLRAVRAQSLANPTQEELDFCELEATWTLLSSSGFEKHPPKSVQTPQSWVVHRLCLSLIPLMVYLCLGLSLFHRPLLQIDPCANGQHPSAQGGGEGTVEWAQHGPPQHPGKVRRWWTAGETEGRAGVRLLKAIL